MRTLAEIDFLQSGASHETAPGANPTAIRSGCMTTKGLAGRPRPLVVTIYDVARDSGVSPATVSRVFNGTGNVDEALAARVRLAASLLGYTPNGAARALRRQRTSLWAVIVADVENPFFTSVVRGVEDAAVKANHRVVLCNSDENLEKEAAYIDVVVNEKMAGVVIAVASTASSNLRPLIDHGIPTVAVDRRPANADVGLASVDNRLGGELATRHLFESGFRRIGCITGPARVDTANDRVAGYRRALRSLRAERSSGWVQHADFREAGGYAAARSLLELDSRPDALVIANSPMTIGALVAIRELGLRIPEDVAIVGFDDSPWATVVQPSLTVVTQPAYELGSAASAMLTGAEPSTAQVTLRPSLVVRDSSVRARH